MYKRQDQDEYTAENIFFVPENARWSAIAAAAHTPEIGTVIDDAMRSIEKENKRLKDILPKNFARPEPVSYTHLPYGREIPKQAHGSINLDGHTSSTRKIMCAVSELFDRIVDKNLLVRRMYVVANHVLPEADALKKNDGAVQLDLFTDYAADVYKRQSITR